MGYSKSPHDFEIHKVNKRTLTACLLTKLFKI